MRTKLLLLTAAAGSFLAASPAYAQFTGPRIEGRLSYEAVEAGIESGDPLATDDEDEAIGYGAELGYDLQLGNVVVGAYLGAEGTDLRSCSEVFGGDEGCVDAGRTLYAGVRAGFSPIPRVLLYARGGYSNGSIEVTYDDGFDSFEADDDFGGYHIGAGAELAVAGGLYGRLEYVHTDYGEFEIDEETIGDFTRGQLMVGLGYRF